MEIPFLELDKKSKAKEEESRWFHYCSSNNIPMVLSRKRSAFGDVDWDCITIDSADDEFLKSEEEFITYELNILLKYYAESKTDADIGSFTGSVHNLPIEHVADFAIDVCNTLSEAQRRYVSAKT